MESELSGMRKRPPQQTSTHFCQRRRQLRSPRTVGGQALPGVLPVSTFPFRTSMILYRSYLLSEPPRFLDVPFGTQRISYRFLFARKRTGFSACAWRIVRSAGRLRYESARRLRQSSSMRYASPRLYQVFAARLCMYTRISEARYIRRRNQVRASHLFAWVCLAPFGCVPDLPRALAQPDRSRTYYADAHGLGSRSPLDRASIASTAHAIRASRA